jgi:sulfopropanediol 3-dehydrogenase
MSLAGADEIYLLGGVQAVAALSLGTESIDETLLVAAVSGAVICRSAPAPMLARPSALVILRARS